LPVCTIGQPIAAQCISRGPVADRVAYRGIGAWSRTHAMLHQKIAAWRRA
jgi:hypothetical protein